MRSCRQKNVAFRSHKVSGFVQACWYLHTNASSYKKYNAVRSVHAYVPTEHAAAVGWRVLSFAHKELSGLFKHTKAHHHLNI